MTVGIARFIVARIKYKRKVKDSKYGEKGKFIYDKTGSLRSNSRQYNYLVLTS